MSEKPLPPELEELVRTESEAEYRTGVPATTRLLAAFARHVLRRAGVPGMMEERERLRNREGYCVEHAAWNPECPGCLEADRDALREERDALRNLLAGSHRLLRQVAGLDDSFDLAEVDELLDRIDTALARKPKESS